MSDFVDEKRAADKNVGKSGKKASSASLGKHLSDFFEKQEFFLMIAGKFMGGEKLKST